MLPKKVQTVATLGAGRALRNFSLRIGEMAVFVGADCCGASLLGQEYPRCQCSIQIIPERVQGGCCGTKASCVFLPPFVEPRITSEEWPCVVDGSCYHNVVVGLVTRTMGPTGLWSDDALGFLRCSAVHVWETLPGTMLVPLSETDYIDTVPSTKRPGLLKALEARDRGIKERFGIFVKREKIQADSAKVRKPRIIVDSGRQFQLQVGPYIVPLYNFMKANGVGLASGLSWPGRCDAISGMEAQLSGGTWLFFDFGKWDRSLLEDVEGASFGYVIDKYYGVGTYERTFKSGTVNKATDRQRRVKGIWKGGRRSGDAHTSLGNGIANLTICYAAALFAGIKQGDCQVMVDGDDVIMLAVVTPEQVEMMVQFCRTLGLDPQGGISPSQDAIEFCSHYFIRSPSTPCGWSYVPLR
eukprot:GHVR01150872.1.p1 GENE.GHVR01150872.1~~GHVR01150872.1.p1  ORF type:complete len:412 (+),score=31.24 GHVR01150872.1:1612-2847(+)